MEKIKIGVLGAYRGMTMIRVLLGHPDAELVAVCDKYRPMLEKVTAEAEKYNQTVTLYDNFDDFIEDEDLEETSENLEKIFEDFEE